MVDHGYLKSVMVFNYYQQCIYNICFNNDREKIYEISN